VAQKIKQLMQNQNQIKTKPNQNNTMMGKQTKQFDVYNEFSGLIKKNFYKERPADVSVYIPTMHVKYTNAAIWHVFQYNGLIVTRIDTVSVKTKDGVSSDFKSVFVHFMLEGTRHISSFSKQVRIRPHADGCRFMRDHFWERDPMIRLNEYWMLLPNKSCVSNTDLTLDQIESKCVALESQVVGEDVDALTANRGFLVEIRAKQNGAVRPYVDTSINVHQLARNIELMEQRVAKTLLEKEAEAEAKAEV
jgi:hypothetical protein